MEIEITKIPRTNDNTDDSKYFIKTPYIISDEFGNEGTFYQKEERLCTEYRNDLTNQRNKFLEEIGKIDTIFGKLGEADAAL